VVPPPVAATPTMPPVAAATGSVVSKPETQKEKDVPPPVEATTPAVVSKPETQIAKEEDNNQEEADFKLIEVNKVAP
jgi:hypothetical protein